MKVAASHQGNARSEAHAMVVQARCGALGTLGPGPGGASPSNSPTGRQEHQDSKPGGSQVSNLLTGWNHVGLPRADPCH